MPKEKKKAERNGADVNDDPVFYGVGKPVPSASAYKGGDKCEKDAITDGHEPNADDDVKVYVAAAHKNADG
jgi:hypothetical protein